MKGLRKTIFFPIFSLFILLIGLSVSEIEAQNKPLTYPEIITALNTKLPNSVFKNKTQLLNFLLTQIRQRKVDKPLTDEREDLLREAGATDELIETIRENPFGAFDTDAPSVPKTVSGGVVNGRAINLVKPPYPPAAKAVRASGAVNVQVTIDEDGNVILASAVSGHNLLRAAAEQAARASKFNPLTISGQKVMMTGVIVYNFSNDNNSTSNSFKNSLGMEFVMIPAGSFMMGSENGESNEKPVHSVTISKSFYMGKTEVTQEQWEKVMGSNPSDLKNCPRCPVDQVSWEDLQNFITELNKKSEGNYRLPTEAEWEYACRAGSTTEYSYGNDEDLLGKYAWFRKNSGSYTHEVGTKQPNAWGLYDMHGNVAEWVQDWKGDYSSSAQTDPVGPTNGSYRVFRGGSFFLFDGLSSAFRNSKLPSRLIFYLGFRLVREF